MDRSSHRVLDITETKHSTEYAQEFCRDYVNKKMQNAVFLQLIEYHRMNSSSLFFSNELMVLSHLLIAVKYALQNRA